MPDRCYGPDATGPGPYVLKGDEAHHLARVRRAAVGDRVELFDGHGAIYDGVIRHVARDAVTLDLGEPRPGREAPFPLTLAVALPKGERLDWLVEKATELGVARLVPIRTARSTVDPRPAKLDRLRRLVIEASKQCGRGTLMDLVEPVEWDSFLMQGGDLHPPPPWRGMSPAQPGGGGSGPRGEVLVSGTTDLESPPPSEGEVGLAATGWGGDRTRASSATPPTPTLPHKGGGSPFETTAIPPRPLRLLAHPGGAPRREWPAVPPSGAILAIGPEGGFTDEEAQSAATAGWMGMGLGSTILRIETAALTGAAVLLLLDHDPNPPGAAHV